jgi:hypothetical protein
MILEQENKLTQGRFREETFTDLMAASLAMLAGPGLEIAYPPEKWTGGDLDLCYWDRRTGERLIVRIQAKRLSPATASKRSDAWKYRHYDHIDHIVPSTGKYQYRTLARRKPFIVPLYAFYHHKSFIENPSVQKLRPAVEGVNLTYAVSVRKKLNRNVKIGLTHRFSPTAKRLTVFQPAFFPLSVLLCVPGKEIPTPREIINNLWFQVFDGLEYVGGVDIESLINMRLDGADDPIAGEYLEGAPFIRISARVQRPTIFLISGLRDE